MQLSVSAQRLLRCVFAVVLLAASSAFAQNSAAPKADNRPWMDKSLSPDQRADLVIPGGDRPSTKR